MNGNFLVSHDDVYLYINKQGNPLRYTTRQEWYNSQFWDCEDTKIVVKKKILDAAMDSVEHLGTLERDVTDTCRETGEWYRILQPNGEAQEIIWIDGCFHHSYEGAIGYESYPSYRFEKIGIDEEDSWIQQ